MKKYYAVKKGRRVGIYNTWNECKKQVDGYSGAKYKSFKNKEDALDFISITNEKQENPIKPVHYDSCKFIKEVIIDLDIPVTKRTQNLVVYVDGSNKQTDIYGFGVVCIDNGIDITHFYGYGYNNEMRMMRNVSGEMLGAINAVEYAVKHHYKTLKIYYDYYGIEKWVTGEWKAKNEFTQMYRDFMRNQPVDISFEKVEAHTGVEFNELADKLAKKAINRE